VTGGPVHLAVKHALEAGTPALEVFEDILGAAIDAARFENGGTPVYDEACRLLAIQIGAAPLRVHVPLYDPEVQNEPEMTIEGTRNMTPKELVDMWRLVL
jgi:hypothetical protein